MKILLPLLAVVFSSFLLTPSITSAQSCGDFIFPYDPNYGDGNGEEVERREIVEDCDNPFNADSPAPFTYELTFAGQTVSDNALVSVVEGESVTGSYTLNQSSGSGLKDLSIFRKEGDDYRRIAYFFEEDFQLDLLQSGEYVAVFSFQELFMQVNETTSWLKRLKELFLPTVAQAFYEDFVEVVAVPFTVEYQAPEPTGASSVLFLPGIQASRLYTEEESGSENQLWEPNRANDVELLGMTNTGASINDIYTKDVMDEIFVFGNIYKSFLKLLENLKEEESIHDYLPFAYDWRYDVFTVATEPIAYPDGQEKLLVEEAKRLAAESYTGKVTIIGHSNGGLVAKALLHEYGEGELAGLVDKVILVGTPQLGTPKAIGSLLHGLEQHSKLKVIFSEATSREATKYMPGAYGLLPTSKFFANSDESVITADNSLIATPISSYGDLSDHSTFIDFLSDNKSTRNTVTNLTQPISLETKLLAGIIEDQQILDNWVAPAGVEVYEVAGTGNPTIKGFHYREFSCKDSNEICVLRPFLKPVLKFTDEGDETVVLKSATAYEGSKTKLIVDLKDESAGIFNKNIEHANLTESDSVKTFLESAILYPYLTDTVVASEYSTISSRFTIIGVHSPVSIVVRNDQGKEVGKVNGEIKEEIVGASYVEFAGSKYVVIPAEEEISVLLQGETEGRYSLTIEELNEANEQTLLQEIIGATSTTGMIAEFSCVDAVCGEVVVDSDADGESDVRFDWSGSYHKLNSPVETIELSTEKRGSNKSSGTRVRDRINPTGLVAGATTINQDDELMRMWNLLLEIQAMIDELNVYYNLNV